MMMMLSHIKQACALTLDGWIEEGGHNYLLCVQYEDTDLGGIIYYGNYLNFAEWARSGGLRCLGICQEDNTDSEAGGHAFVFRGVAIQFKKVAGLGAGMCSCIKTVRLSGLRLTLEQIIKSHEAGHILAGVVRELLYVPLDGSSDAMLAIMPDEMINSLTDIYQYRGERY